MKTFLKKFNPLKISTLKMAFVDSAVSQITRQGIEMYERKENMSDLQKEQKMLWERAKFLEKRVKKEYRKEKITHEEMLEGFQQVDQIIAKINVLKKEEERQQREAELHEQNMDMGLNS